MTVLSRAAAVLDEHSVMEMGIVSWRCGCGYEGTMFPPDHIAQALAEAGLLKEDT